MGASTHWQSAATCALVATLLSLIAALALGKLLIHAFGRRLQERIVSDSPWLARLHHHKAATPTMGGLFVVAAILAALVATIDWTEPGFPAIALLLAGLTALGAWDDLKKLRLGKGLLAKQKLTAQFILAATAMAFLYAHQADAPGNTHRWLPGLGIFDLGTYSIPLGILVIVGSSNAVNLTDGLDGLAGGCLAIAFAALGAVALVVGDVSLAATCGVVAVPAAGGMAIVCGAACGAVLGFLKYNRHPARVFLGDTGALPLGGLLGLVAVIARQELLLLVIAGVFVAEAASVMLQVGYFKWRRRRIFLCAPLHHHFQFLGWEERKIVRRFWMAAGMCAVLALAGWSVTAYRAGHETVDGNPPQPQPSFSYNLAGANYR